jgi:O-antigen ligase
MEQNLPFIKKTYIPLVWLVTALSSIVIFEPAPYDILIFILFFIGFFSSKLIYKQDLRIGYLFIFIFIMSNLLSMFGIYYINRGLRYFTITLYLIMAWFFFVGLFNKYGERIYKVIFSGYTFSALFSTTIGILAFFHMIPSSELFLKFGRTTGLFKDPNVFGPFLIPISLYAILKSTKSKRLIKLFWIITFVMTTLGVILSFSRAAWGNYVVSIFIFLFLWGIKLNSKKILIRKHFFTLIILLIFILSIVFITIMNIDIVYNFIIQRFAFQHYDNERFSTQVIALDSVINNPFGIGPGQSELVYNYATHSLYVRVLTENGFLGFFGFVGFVFISLYRLIKLYYVTDNAIFALVFSSLIGLMLNSFTIDSIHWRHFWLLLAFPWTSYYCFKLHKNQKELGIFS